MDPLSIETRKLIEISGQAAESVIRFRAIAFNPRCFIDVKAVKAVISSAIHKEDKEQGYKGKIPIVAVVNCAGAAAARAARKWNSAQVANPDAEIDQEWLRQSVRALVQGAVHNRMTCASRDLADRVSGEQLECLDHVGNTNVFNPRTRKINHPVRAHTTPHPDNAHPGYTGLSFYGFGPGETERPTMFSHKEESGGNDASQSAQPNLLRHQVTTVWTAVNKMAASSSSALDIAEARGELRSLNLKRPSPCESCDVDDSDNDERDSQRGAKRARSGGSSPTVIPSRAISVIDGGDEGCGLGKRRIVKVSWTEEEIELLLKTRMEGKGWDVISDVLPKHSRGACQKKYYDVSRERRGAKASTSEESSVAADRSHSASGSVRDGEDGEDGADGEDGEDGGTL